MKPVPLRRRLASAVFLLLLAAVLATAARGYFLLRRFESERVFAGAALLDIDGNVFATAGKGAGLYVPLDGVPPHVVDAVVAIEDARFWQHPGLDPIGIARALLVNLRRGRPAQGASTITQQLARNLFLTPEKTILRKVQEAVYALVLEARYSKQEILELYLNEAYFGEGAYGIAAASQVYFGKPAESLTLAEGALLAGLLQAPSRYTPYRNPEGARDRRDVVLARMEELGMIGPRERAAAQQEPVALAPRRAGRAPYFADYVAAWLRERFDAATLSRAGLRVRTTLDPRVQEAAEKALGDHQGAIVVLDVATGAIRAMVGGRDYRESQFNRAVDAVRQPGSAFKPFVFAAALERGWQMNHLVEDVPRSYGGYAPRNFRDEYWGPVTMKQALSRSLNNGAVWLLREIGVTAGVEMAERLGISTLTPDDRHLGLALGGLKYGTTPLEMAAAYLPFASGGIRREPFAVLEVTDASGKVYYRHRPASRRVLSEEVAYFITDMLREAVERGTGTAAAIGRPQAGKTGTADHQVSAWFVGYTPELVASVYVGNDDGSPLSGGGGTLAAPIWGRLMAEALRGRPVQDFPVPDYVVTSVPVDFRTGLLAGEGCPHREMDAFVVGRAPTEYSPCAWTRVNPPPDAGPLPGPAADPGAGAEREAGEPLPPGQSRPGDRWEDYPEIPLPQGGSVSRMSNSI